MKRFITTIKIFSAVAFAGISLTSCLKDAGLGLSGFEGGEWVSIPLAKNAVNGMALEAKDEFQDVNLCQLTYDYVSKAESDISVTLERADAAVTAADPTMVIMPAANLQIPSATVTIPKGGRVSNTFSVKIKTTGLDPAKAYGLAFTIKGVGKAGVGVPSNLRTVVFKFAIKNKYDGVYEVTGSMVDNANSALTGKYPLNWELRTTGPNTVAVFDRDYGTQTHLILNGGGLSQYGSFGLNMTFDNATNAIISVVNSYGQPSSNGRSAALDPSGVNTYDPATKTIKIKYSMLQPSVIAGVRTSFTETWVWKKAR